MSIPTISFNEDGTLNYVLPYFRTVNMHTGAVHLVVCKNPDQAENVKETLQAMDDLNNPAKNDEVLVEARLSFDELSDEEAITLYEARLYDDFEGFDTELLSTGEVNVFGNEPTLYRTHLSI